MSRSQLRVLLAGYGLPAEFAVTALFGLGFSPRDIAILTHQDDARNRGLHALAALRGISTCEAPAKSDKAASFIEGFAADLLLSVHYRSLIPGWILDSIPLGGLNLHPSLLPDYRGANSVAWAIINGETETGFTFHRMDARFDTGKVILQESFFIKKKETSFSLFHRQIVRAMARIETVIERLIDGEVGSPQPEGGSYYTRALPFGGKIDLSWSDEQIERFIRAMVFPPFRPAIIEIDGKSYDMPDMQTFIKLRSDLGLQNQSEPKRSP